jgi:cobalt-zinc-cadmium efflux system protein
VGGSARSLAIALALTAAYTVGEAVAGFASGGVALLADAGHNLSDVVALAVALGAVWLARRPATPSRSFGLMRAEVLAALANALVLVAVGLVVVVESAQRLSDPPPVAGAWLLVVAGVGIAVNAAAAGVVFRRGGEDLNLRASFLHLAADAVASLAVVVAGLVIVVTGWNIADPVAGLFVGLLMLAGSWSVLRDSVLVLLEAAPRGIDPEEVGRALAATAGVVEVHDLHVWTITSGFPALSAHVLVRPGDDCHGIRRALERTLHDRFGIEHTTLQVDHQAASRLLAIGGRAGQEASGGG